ncbi:DUF3017 domain-containing protein [Streptomyces sp. NPDC000594]|uniref:DUF3017 domain-containing protein n=1 Tax=Streptomyces sp. NPDC000594 TaxID=3154261 RepID=UPI003316F26C
MNDDREVRATAGTEPDGAGAIGPDGVPGDPAPAHGGTPDGGTPDSGASDSGASDGGTPADGTPADGNKSGDRADGGGTGDGDGDASGGGTGEDGTGDGESGDGDTGEHPAPRAAGSRRPPTLTTDTARPEGGGRAAPGDAPAPARQWPLLSVLGLTGVGLLIVGLDLFSEAFRVGTILIGVSLIAGGVMRRILPSVGMLAVRSRFTDMITYGLLGVAITLLALVAQPEPWLELPFLETIVRSLVGR